MNLKPFEEKEISEWVNTLGLHGGAVYKSPHKSWQALEREEQNFKKNGYKMSLGRFSVVWVADPRKS